jgi:transposase-like protein
MWEKDTTMATKQTRYPAEFKARIVELARSGRSQTSLAKEFKVTTTTIRAWVVQADRDEGRRSDGLTSDEKKELTQLRRENARLKEEREILSKAAAWFAQEGVGTPKKRFDS